MSNRENNHDNNAIKNHQVSRGGRKWDWKFTGYSESSSSGVEKFKWPPTIGVKIRSEPKPTSDASAASVEI